MDNFTPFSSLEQHYPLFVTRTAFETGVCESAPGLVRVDVGGVKNAEHNAKSPTSSACYSITVAASAHAHAEL